MKSLKKNFQPGDIVSTPKFPGINHVGIVISDKLIAHNSPSNGIVLERYEDFSENSSIKYQKTAKNPSLAVSRAIALADRGIEYNLFIRNCEHFVTYCEGESKPNSPQLKVGTALLALFVFFIILD